MLKNAVPKMITSVGGSISFAPKSSGEKAKWLDDDTRHMLAELDPAPDQVTIAIGTSMMDVVQMWSEDDGAYTGTHYRLNETVCEPQPIRHPPILIGGDGEKKTLRLVAQYADIWNSISNDVDALAHKIEVLNRHCEKVGRDPGDIRKTSGGLAGTDPFDDRLSDNKMGDALAEGRDQRSYCEQNSTEHEHALATEEVTQASAGNGKGGQRQRVGSNDPLQALDISIKLPDDRPQRNVQQSCVYHDNCERKAQHDQHSPSA